MRVFSHFDFAVPVISSSSDESCLTPSTSDESCSDSGSLSLLRERNKPHYWTEEQRRVLCVLERWFYSFSYKRVGQLTPSDRKRVFCAYFYDEFHGDTNPKTISENATLAQILKIKSHGAANEAWRKVYLETKFDDPGGVWEYSKQELLAVAKDLNIDIRLKTTEDTTAVLKGAKLSARRKRRQPRDDWSTTDESDWDISTDELDQEVTLPNRKRRLYRVSRQGAGTPNSSKSLNKTKPVARSRSDRSDKIGYRWFADERCVSCLVYRRLTTDSAQALKASTAYPVSVLVDSCKAQSILLNAIQKPLENYATFIYVPSTSRAHSSQSPATSGPLFAKPFAAQEPLILPSSTSSS